MQGQALNILLIIAILFAADWYILKGIRAAFKKQPFVTQRLFFIFYWFASGGLITGLLVSVYSKLFMGLRAAFLLGFFLIFIFKVFFILFMLIDDARRYFKSRRKKNRLVSPVASAEKPTAIPRSEFLMKAGLLAGVVPLAAIKLTMDSGLYDYQVKQVKLYLPNLPKAFDGLRVGQISDIHSGSFYNKRAVQGGVEMLLNQKTDVIFFTGDLVNGQTREMYGYQDIFSKVKAPLGVFSILGNHDYGDYGKWPNPAAKLKNNRDLIVTHKNMGWDLLVDEHRRLKVGNEEIGILGIGNWGEMSRFPRYGRMDKAVLNTGDLPVKLLLSHDPSHWRAQVLPQYPQIDAMFSGHTHGMQFGIRNNYVEWSPIEYVYREWAGLYQEGRQQIYVNVGYGFIGFNGRIGILPEITIFELKAGAAQSAQKA